MSTKIYNAFRLRGDLNAAFCLFSTAENRARVAGLARDRVGDFVTRQAVRKIDKMSLGMGDGSNFVSAAYRQWWDLEKNKTSIADTEVTVSLIPYGDFTLGMVFSPFRETDFLFDLPGVERFDYWNNTGHPEELSEEEWDARGRIWEVACPTTPAEAGVSLQLSASMLEMLYGKQLLQYVPSLADRALGIAQDELVAMRAKRSQALGEELSPWDIMKALQQSEVVELAADYESRLPVITVELLNG